MQDEFSMRGGGTDWSKNIANQALYFSCLTYSDAQIVIYFRWVLPYVSLRCSEECRKEQIHFSKLTKSCFCFDSQSVFHALGPKYLRWHSAHFQLLALKLTENDFGVLNYKVALISTPILECILHGMYPALKDIHIKNYSEDTGTNFSGFKRKQVTSGKHLHFISLEMVDE